MPVNGIFDTSIDLLGKSMDLRVKNQTLIAGNLANAETPGYTPVELSFEKELKEALKGKDSAGSGLMTTNPRHISTGRVNGGIEGVQGHVVEVPSGTAGKDGNSVELEAQMAKMAENQIMYNASVQILSVKFDELKNAVKGGS